MNRAYLIGIKTGMIYTFFMAHQPVTVNKGKLTL